MGVYSLFTFGKSVRTAPEVVGRQQTPNLCGFDIHILYYEMRTWKTHGAASPGSPPSGSAGCCGHSCALTGETTAWSRRFARPDLAGGDQLSFLVRLTASCRRAIGPGCPTFWPSARPPPAGA